MDNLNNGSVVDFNQIEDYQKAARDFSEGNKDLEQLLLNCFSKGIKTTACCGGHEDKKIKPYISFSYSSENEPCIYAIISKLKDSGFNFRYNKLSNGKSFFSIEEGQYFGKTMTLFNDINNVINSFDKEKDYYAELPQDLQKYSSIIKISENDDFLKLDGTSDYFQMCYQKALDGYEYSMFTNDPYYNSVAEKENFTKVSMEKFTSYNLKVPNREMAVQRLNGIATNIQSFDNKKSETSSIEQPQQIKSEEDELELSFEYDERTRSNPLINHLRVNAGDTIEIVAQKLKKCRAKGINAFAVLNGIEVNNYKSNDPEYIIEAYNQSINKSDEMANEKTINRNQYEQNQQNLSFIEGVTRSSDRDDLNEAIDERLYRIEHDKENGQYIEDKKGIAIDQTVQAIEQLDQPGQINAQVDTNGKQPHLHSEEDIRENQHSIEAFGQNLIKQNKEYEHFINMRDTQRQQDQLIRRQQLGQLSQQDIQQTEGMRR